MSEWKIVRFWWNLVHCIRYWTRLQSRDQKLQFFKLNMAAAWKSLIWPLLINRLSVFSEILYEKAEWHADKGYGTKNANVQNSRWRTAAILKIVQSPYLSKKIVRFWWDLVHYIRYWSQLQSRDQKMKFFGIQDGGNRHLEIRFFGHNSSTDCPISAKFCMGKQNGVPTKATW